MNDDFLKQLSGKIKADTKPAVEKVQETQTAEPVETEKESKNFVKVGKWLVKYEN